LVNNSFHFDEHFIAFANSTIESSDQNTLIVGLVGWVGQETRALNMESSGTFRQPLPFFEYTTKGFLLSLFGMLSLATLDAIVSYYVVTSEETVLPPDLPSFGTIWVNHVIYLNMMVPQAMEQLRYGVFTFLSFQFRSEMKCNNKFVVDVLAYVNRIVSDKTGTLTQNKMVPKVSMLFHSTNVHQFYVDVEESHVEHQLLHHHQHNAEAHHISHIEMEEIFGENSIAIMSTTGMEPEERALAHKIRHHAKIKNMELPEPDDDLFGEISYHNEKHKSLHTLKIHIAFGFWRNFLAKFSLCENLNSGKFYMAVQAGGDEFWRGETGIQAEESVGDKLLLWEKHIQSNPDFQFNGAPRGWSHGLKEISQEMALAVIQQWRKTWSIEEEVQRKKIQEEIIINAIKGVRLVSKTLMIDAYRDGVGDAIKILYKNGKQVYICTGDSASAASTIAQHFEYPFPFIHIDGSSENSLECSLNSVEEKIEIYHENKNRRGRKSPNLPSKNKPHCTLFFNQACMERLQSIQKHNESFTGPIFQKIISLLQLKDKKGRYIYYAVFCRATPGLKPFVVELMQQPSYHQEEGSLFPFWKASRNYVLAMGDGANDINMMKVADASIGIDSGETKDVISQANLYHTDWSPVVPLLLSDGPEKATLVSTMIKLLFLKHWMTALALWADLVLHGFPLLPFDPCSPLLMAIYNGVVFSQIASHSISDSFSDPTILSNKQLMSVRAFLRWAFAAACSGVIIDFVVRSLFHSTSSAEFGGMIQVGQAFSLTVYLALSTNTWANENENSLKNTGSDENSTTNSFTSSLTHSGTKIKNAIRIAPQQVNVAIISLILGILMVVFGAKNYDMEAKSNRLSYGYWIGAFLLGYPSRYLFYVFSADFSQLKKSLGKFQNLPQEEKLLRFVNWSHTPHGRILPIILFTYLIKIVTGTSFLALIIISVLVSFLSAIIFFLFISRLGFLRALFDGKSVALILTSFLIGYLVGISND
jgi:magnesium-transporting ATPase (P-type)